jgi:hypothetical protein
MSQRVRHSRTKLGIATARSHVCPNGEVNAFLEGCIGRIGDTSLDGAIESIKPYYRTETRNEET